MAIEVRELIIKATIVNNDSNNGNAPVESSVNNNVTQNQELIATCIEKVLEILSEKERR